MSYTDIAGTSNYQILVVLRRIKIKYHPNKYDTKLSEEKYTVQWKLMRVGNLYECAEKFHWVHLINTIL